MSLVAKAARPGKTDYEINRLIAGRWSSRAVDSEIPLDEMTLNRILEAGRWAPSAFNNQPWRFLVVKEEERERMEKARAALLPGNSWALKAPVLMFMCTLVPYEGRERKNPLSGYEAGMAAVLMALEASDLGLVFHQMLGFKKDVVRAGFNVPEELDILTAIAIGFPGSIEDVPESKRSMETDERTRKSISELIYIEEEQDAVRG